MFGSAGRVKIMKLFLFNSEDYFEKNQVVKRTKISSDIVVKELKLLEDINLIKKKTYQKAQISKKTGKTNKKKVQGYILNPDFPALKPLKNLLINQEPLQYGDLIKRLGRAGKVKLIIISGIFLQLDDSRVDLFIVGDDMKDRSLKNTINYMETEIGHELRYSVLETKDFSYRMSVCDRLVRDVLDYPHEIIIDKIGIN